MREKAVQQHAGALGVQGEVGQATSPGAARIVLSLIKFWDIKFSKSVNFWPLHFPA